MKLKDNLIIHTIPHPAGEESHQNNLVRESSEFAIKGKKKARKKMMLLGPKTMLDQISIHFIPAMLIFSGF